MVKVMISDVDGGGYGDGDGDSHGVADDPVHIFTISSLQ